MSERLSTAGMLLLYAVETEKGTRPTAKYTEIPEIKSMPSFNPQPNTIQSTTLKETEYHTYVMGLKDLGGALEYGANLTQDFITAVNTMVDAYEEAAKEGNAMWFCMYHPKLNDALYYQGEPSRVSFNEAEVDAMLETTLYITPNSAPIFEAKPTDIATYAIKNGVNAAVPENEVKV